MGIEQGKGEATTCSAKSQTQRKKKTRREKNIPNPRQKETQRENGKPWINVPQEENTWI